MSMSLFSTVRVKPARTRVMPSTAPTAILKRRNSTSTAVFFG